MHCIKLLAGIVFAGSLLITTSCNKVKSKEADYYFSVNDYFEKEILRMTSSEMKIRKSIEQEGNVETLIDSTPDWKKELSLFKSFDINKAANSGAYSVDTVASIYEQRHVIIEAIDYKKSPVRHIDIILNADNKIEMITMVKSLKESLYESELTVNYQPDKGYDINGFNKSAGSAKHEFSIHAEMIGL